MVELKETLNQVERIVIKIGSSLLASHEGGLHKKYIQNITDDISALKQSCKEIILVTSGAIGTGMVRLGLTKRPITIPEKQAVAAVGQCLLMKEYEEAFRQHGYFVGQLLLTAEDLSDRQRYANARQTLLTLLGKGIVPIINENDTVAVDEIKFGDNDRLSALVTNLVGAHLLIVLTDVDGFYTSDPRKDKKALPIPVVNKITPELMAQAGGTGSSHGTGGMTTKLLAAQIVNQAGVGMVIANGLKPKILLEIFRGERCGTFFAPTGDRMAGRKRWIAFSKKTSGTLTVDEGAKEVLRFKGKSLLPSGIVKIEGDFGFGDAVNIVSTEGNIFAVGMVKYSSMELEKIKGKQTKDIAGILGQKFYDEVVHRDDLVIL